MYQRQRTQQQKKKMKAKNGTGRKTREKMEHNIYLCTCELNVYRNGMKRNVPPTDFTPFFSGNHYHLSNIAKHTRWTQTIHRSTYHIPATKLHIIESRKTKSLHRESFFSLSVVSLFFLFVHFGDDQKHIRDIIHSSQTYFNFFYTFNVFFSSSLVPFSFSLLFSFSVRVFFPRLFLFYLSSLFWALNTFPLLCCWLPYFNKIV